MVTREVWGIIGQSEAVGRGLPLSPPPNYTNIKWPDNSPRIWMMPQPIDAGVNSFYPPALINPARSFVQAVDPLQPGKEIGFGIAAADKYIDLRGDDELEIGIVQCAWGGTKIKEDWASSYRSSHLLPTAWTRLRAAQQWGTLTTILFDLGQNDALAGPTPNHYPEEVHRIFDHTRIQVGILDLLFIFVALGTLPSGLASQYGNWDQIQSWIVDRMSGVSPDIGVVETTGLATNGTMDLHRTAASQVTVGHRIAQKIVDLRP